jgi:hypothetical protein
MNTTQLINTTPDISVPKAPAYGHLPIARAYKGAAVKLQDYRQVDFAKRLLVLSCIEFLSFCQRKGIDMMQFCLFELLQKTIAGYISTEVRHKNLN